MFWKNLFKKNVQSIEWTNSNNSEIAKSWHNLNETRAPAEWMTVVKNMQCTIKMCEISVPPENTTVEGGDWTKTTINYKGETLQITCRMDIHKETQQHLKHVCVRIPDRLIDINMLTHIALSFGQQETSFYTIKSIEKDSYAHLIWPLNWDEFHHVLRDSKLMPLCEAPLTLEKTEEAYKLPNGIQVNFSKSIPLENWQKKITHLGLDKWARTLRANLDIFGTALTYLDLQVGRDLFLWQLPSVNPVIQITGETFFSIIKFFLDDRLGECPSCGYKVCNKYARNNDIIDKNDMNNANKCNQWHSVQIWPLSPNWWLGKFKYVCPQCKTSPYIVKCVRVLDPSPVIPQLGAFMDSINHTIELNK